MGVTVHVFVREHLLHKDYLQVVVVLQYIYIYISHGLAPTLQWALNVELLAAVEDPFDATDNCARTIGFSRIDSILEAFGRAAGVMNAARDDMGSSSFGPHLFHECGPRVAGELEPTYVTAPL